jgi:hypothetical protein
MAALVSLMQKTAGLRPLCKSITHRDIRSQSLIFYQSRVPRQLGIPMGF